VVDDATVGLAEAIDKIRAELAQAQARGADKDLRFRVGEVQLELAFELAKEIGAEAGVSCGSCRSVARARSRRRVPTLATR
jgi:hypothetical protein